MDVGISSWQSMACWWLDALMSISYCVDRSTVSLNTVCLLVLISTVRTRSTVTPFLRENDVK